MDREGQLFGLDRNLQTLGRLWEQRRSAAANRPASLPATAHGVTIALSREVGTHGTAVGHAVGSRLGWPVYDQELLERIAQDMGVQKKLLDSVDEKGMGWLEEAFASFVAVPFVSDGAYVRHLVTTILALGVHGECVIVGRGGAFILPAATTLRVRLIAPLKDRIAALCRESNVSPAEAAHQIDMGERHRNRFVQYHFSKDPADLHNYNLILDFATFSVEGCAQVIADAARHLQGTLPSALVSNSTSGSASGRLAIS